MDHSRPWPENCWYAVCTSTELGQEPLGRTICKQAIVLYRNERGDAVALEDFCPHRGLPLSMGSLRDGKLVCGYHGMVMNDDGSCHSMVGQDASRFPGIRHYPLIERYGFIWLWPGEPRLASSQFLPQLDWAESEKWAYGGGYYHLDCDYRLLIDNLMDLTHETYVHASSIGQPEIEDAAPTLSRHDGEVRVSRVMEGIKAPPFWADALSANGLAADQPCDRWQICRFSPPGQVMIDVGVALAGQGGPEAPSEKRVSGIVVDLITPETETSCHYFWGMARNFQVEDAELTETMRSAQGKIFAEDKDVLESQQRNLLRNPERRLMSLNIDAGGLHARRLLAKMIEKEQGIMAMEE